MPYSPTAADYAHILANNPRAFADTGAARTVLGQRQRSPNAPGNEHRMDALGRNYAQGGNAPLTRSPMRASADAGFGAACVTCQPNRPCCLTGGTVTDISEPTRKLVWPVAAENPKTKMLIVAKEIDAGRVSGNVQLKGTGSDCKDGKPNMPGFNTSTTNGPVVVHHSATTNINIGYFAMPSWTMALKEIIPEKYLLAMIIADIVFSGAVLHNQRRGSRIQPMQCSSYGLMQRSFEIKPMAYFELTADATASVGIHFLTTGLGGSASIEGNLTGKYGALDIAAAASATAIGSSGRAVATPGQAPGMVGTVASIISNFSEYVKLSSPDPNPVVDRTTFGSGVRFDKTLKLTGTGIKLEAKKSSPDLEAKIANLETSLSLKATGTLDFIDLAANIMLSPAGARMVQEARAQIANPDNAVRGEARCEIQVSAEGELKHKVESGMTVLIPAEGEASRNSEGLNKEFGGKIKVRGMAQILIHVEGEVWIASAEAGAAGTMHTGWNWEMKIDNEKKRKKRYFFEGLIARAVGYARVGVKSKARRGPTETSTTTGKSSRGVTGTTQGPATSVGDRNWRDPYAERSELENGGRIYELLAPTVPRVTDTAPPWQDY